MNKIFIQKIYTRIGFWIKYERKRLFELTGNSNYKQEQFIQLHASEKFLDFVPNETICSRSTLSRIENGKVIYETSLITFFLKRLNRKYRILELEHRLIEETTSIFHNYIFKCKSISVNQLKKILDDTNVKVVDNFLWDEDYLMLNRIIDWVGNFALIQKNEFDVLYQKFKFYHKQVQDIVIFYMAYSVYFNPELWIKHQLVSNLIKEEYESNELLSVFDDLFNNRPNQIFKTFYRNRQILLNSGFLYETILPINIMVEKRYFHLPSKYHNLNYMSLVHKIIVKEYKDNSIFEACIFAYLKYSTIDNEHDITRLLLLIKDEPYPRAINELVLKQLFPKIKSKSIMQKILSFMLD